MDLRNAGKMGRRIRSLRERIDILNSAKEYGERIQHNGAGSNYPTDRMADIVARIDELTREMISLTLDRDIEIVLAEEAISHLSESEQKIAEARYVDGLTWSEVSKKTRYSVSHCRNANMSIIKKVSTQ